MIALKENVEGYAKISTISYDGLVGSFELDNKKFAMRIKWHPELMIDDDVEPSIKLVKRIKSRINKDK